MAFKKSNSSAGEEFAARKRPPLGPKDQIDVNDVATLKYYITDYGKILPTARSCRRASPESPPRSSARSARASSAPATWASWPKRKGALQCISK